MSLELVEKLVQSFDDLENCIAITKKVLDKKQGVPADVIARVGQYSDIVVKQRNLATDLQDYLNREDWEEVARHIKIINGLSAMIREDAQAILAGAMQEAPLIASKEEDVLL